MYSMLRRVGDENFTGLIGGVDMWEGWNDKW
jgi:hypothetical protein